METDGREGRGEEEVELRLAHHLLAPARAASV